MAKLRIEDGNIAQNPYIRLERVEIWKCEQCPRAFLEQISLDRHYDRHDLECLEEHMESAEIKVERIEVYQCPHCSRAFLSAHELHKHRLKHIVVNDCLTSKQNNIRSDTANNNTVDKPFKCEECGLRFVAESTLEAHSAVHEPFGFICDCGIGYYVKRDLELHKKLVHPSANAWEPKTSYSGPKPKPVFLVEPAKSESDTSTTDEEDTNYQPSHKVGPRLKAELSYIKPKNEAKKIKRKKKRTKTSKTPKIRRRERNKENSPELEVNAAGRYACPHCKDSYLQKQHVFQHMAHVHKVEFPYKCDLCSKSFCTSTKLERHRYFHSNQVTCELCNKVLKSKASYETHLKVHAGIKAYECKLCSKKYSQSFNLKLHNIKKHGAAKMNEYECEYCGKKFLQLANLKRHEAIHTGKKDYVCKFCNKPFADQSARWRHERIHTGEKRYFCDVCPAGYGDYSAYARHVLRHAGPRQARCPICHKSVGKESIRHHIATQHRMEYKYECDHCNKKFVLKQYLFLHLQRMHKQLYSKTDKTKCRFCSKIFQSVQEMRDHITSAHVECDLCKNKFDRLTNLMVHKLNKKDKCSVCYSLFCSESAKTEHLMKVHEYGHLDDGNTTFVCCFCPEEFDVKSSLRKHIVAMHAKETDVYVCEHCNEISGSKRKIINHIWDKHMLCAYCNKCSRRFFSESEFVRHKKICGLKSWTCEICEKIFPSTHLLKKHERSHMAIK